MTAIDPEAHYRELCAKVDAFFADIHSRYRDRMSCGSGCFDCCKDDRSIALVEAAAIARHLAAAGQALSDALAAGGEIDGYCAALSAGGSCRIYDARPLVCRSHGVPIRRTEPGHQLPVVDVCFRNFEGSALERVPASDQLDQNTLSTMLAAVDGAFADSVGAPRGTRLSLAALLANPRELFELE